MRVLHIMECTIGGARRHIVDASSGLARRGNDVHLVASSLRQPDFEGDLALLESRGVRVTRLQMVRAIRPATDAAHLYALARLLEREQPDVVHTHSSKAGVLGRLASIETGIGARVHTPHTFAFLFDSMFSGLKRALFREIERGLGGHTQALIAVSASEARTIRASGIVPFEHVRTIPNGIDPTPWMSAEAAPRAELADDPTAPLAVCVGLLNVAKGQDLLLETLVQPGLERLHVAFAGHGEMDAHLRALAQRLGVARRVRFLGFRRDVPALVAASDVVVLPSRWEAMPYAVLEAMAGARAVVATPVDGARDLVLNGETGFLAGAISAHALAQALRAWIDTSIEERRRLGTNARARLCANYGVEALLDGLERVYAEVA